MFGAYLCCNSFITLDDKHIAFCGSREDCRRSIAIEIEER